MTGPTTVSAKVHVFRQHDDHSLHERPHESCVFDEGAGGAVRHIAADGSLSSLHLLCFFNQQTCKKYIAL